MFSLYYCSIQQAYTLWYWHGNDRNGTQ